MPPKLIFRFDKHKDLWNAWYVANHKAQWQAKVSKEVLSVLSLCKGKRFEECKHQLEKLYQDFYKSPLIKQSVKLFQAAWNKIGNEFFKRLERMTKKPFPFNQVTVYLTTQPRCPYNVEERWLMVCFFGNIFYAVAAIAHELMHLHFHHYYWEKVEREIGHEKAAELKEALTVLLNLEFRDLWFVLDKGKPGKKQQALRKFVEAEWKKKKDFDGLIKKCVAYLRSHG
jgi:hypothetical protein